MTTTTSNEAALLQSTISQIKQALSKSATSRSFDDILLLKSYVSQTEFVATNLTGIVNPNQMNEFCRGMLLETHRAGEIIFNQGDVGTKLYIILSGSCEVKVKYTIRLTAEESEVREKIFATLVSGQYFGERALQNSEKRAATIVARTDCDLIVITKALYSSLIEDTKIETLILPLKDRKNQLGSKDNLMQVLSTIREKRTNYELEAAAVYLHRNIPFFIRFTLPQIVELCRVAETVTIQGHNILFRQGQTGQAFYVILGGEVEVWVDDSKGPNPAVKSSGSVTARSEATALTNTSKNYLNLVSDLGKKVAALSAGDVFGEKALESGNIHSERMASIVTCVDYTDLLVIYKEDYLNLVYTIMNSESMDRLSLLRRTEMFRSVDVVHLKVLARFMEPRRYKIDETLYKAGESALEMIITLRGECRVLTEITEDSNKKKNKRRAVTPKSSSNDPFTGTKSNDAAIGHITKKGTTTTTAGRTKIIDAGRIAPHSVLSAYITLCESAYHDMLHTESVVAATIVDCYLVSKHDFFLHVPKETKIALKKIVSEFNALPVYPLWENVPRTLDREEWVQDKCWETFRKDLVKSEKKDASILDHFKRLSTVSFQSADREIIAKNEESTEAALSEQNRNVVVNPVKITLKDWGLKSVRRDSTNSKILEPLLQTQRQQVMRNEVANELNSSLQRSMTRKIRTRMNHSLNVLKEDSKLLTEITLESPNAAMSSFGFDDYNSAMEDAKYSNNNGKPKVAPAAVTPPFSLVQFHKESVGSSGNAGMSDSNHRLVSCHLRVCCCFNTSAEVKAYADKFMENIFLTMYKSDHTLENELLLRWKFFKGFPNMVLTANDHFLIYCRGTPIEYASIYASKNIFAAPFPAVCKLDQQMFACVVMNQVKPRAPNMDLEIDDGSSDDETSVGTLHTPFTTAVAAAAGSSTKSNARRRNTSVKSNSDHSHNEHALHIQVPHNSSAHKSTTLSKDPQFLLDFSSMHEVVAIFPTKLAGLQYAVERFGFVGGPFEEMITANRGTHHTLIHPHTPHAKLDSPTRSGHQSNQMNNKLQSPINHVTGKAGPLSSSKNISFTPTALAAVSFQNNLHPPTTPHRTNTGRNIVRNRIALKDLSVMPTRDRILEVLHTGTKLCCIVPLYEWVSISEDTLQSMNFLKAFDVPDLSLTELLDRTLQMQKRGSSSRLTTSRPNTAASEHSANTGNEENDRDSTLATKMELVKTFSEVGLLKKPNNDRNHGSNRDDYLSRLSIISQNQAKIASKEFTRQRRTNKLDPDPFLESKLVASRSVQNLETTMQNKELTKSLSCLSEVNIHCSNYYNTNNSSTGSSSVVLNHSKRPTSTQRGVTRSSLHSRGSIGTSSNTATVSAADISDDLTIDNFNDSNNADDNEESFPLSRNKATPKIDADVLNHRLNQLNKSAEQRSQVLAMHDKLCEVEHLTYSDAKYRFKLSSIPSGSSGPLILPPKGNQIKIDDPRMGFINETLGIVESLQHMTVNSKYGVEKKYNVTSFVNKSNSDAIQLTRSVNLVELKKKPAEKTLSLVEKLKLLSNTFKP